MVCVRSARMLTSIAGGIAACSRGSAALMRSTVSMTLAPGCLKMISRTAAAGVEVAVVGRRAPG